MIKLHHLKNEDLFPLLANESIDIIPIDPPYKYLKNQKLEVDFDEQLFFDNCKRVLTKDGFIILFGRGASFYRWNVILENLGFTFKEEIIWNKSHCTSPLMNISRVHETVSIWTKGKGIIQKVKIPYLEMKGHDFDAIIADIKRLKSTFNNTGSFDAVLNYINNNKVTSTERMGLSTTVSSEVKSADRCSSVMKALKEGFNEKTIIRTDFYENSSFTKHNVTGNRKDGDRCVKVVNSILQGMNEKTIIKEIRSHYTSIHPTQKPVRLLERLIQLVIVPSKNKCVIADFFGGSFSTMEAVHNLSIKFPEIEFEGLSCEMDEEYFNAGENRINQVIQKDDNKAMA